MWICFLNLNQCMCTETKLLVYNLWLIINEYSLIDSYENSTDLISAYIMMYTDSNLEMVNIETSFRVTSNLPRIFYEFTFSTALTIYTKYLDSKNQQLNKITIQISSNNYIFFSLSVRFANGWGHSRADGRERLDASSHPSLQQPPPLDPAGPRRSLQHRWHLRHVPPEKTSLRLDPRPLGHHLRGRHSRALPLRPTCSLRRETT